ncbi:MAG: phytanoyl-CoA dioxygenase family protein [Pseudomonadota bacterium]
MTSAIDEVARYFKAAGIAELPNDLSKPRPASNVPHDQELRLASYERCVTATRLWNAAETDEQRRRVIKDYAVSESPIDGLAELMQSFLAPGLHRLPPEEIEHAMDELGLSAPNNNVLSDVERHALDTEGFVNLGVLLNEDQLSAMRMRYDDAIVAEAPQTRYDGIGRINDTVVAPMNRDGLLDPIFVHPRLLAAVRHLMGVHIKYIGSNYHCSLPGYGHQGIHADYIWGVKGRPEVVNAVWMIDAFTEDNGATRVVPGSHRWARHPTGDLVDGKPRNTDEPVEGQVLITGAAGSCFVYNAHLWHGGTQNRTPRLRRAQHAFFSRSNRPSSTDVPAVIDETVFKRLGRVERAVLDVRPEHIDRF